MTILGRDAILQAQDISKELVHVPEWGGDVYVKGMTGAERDKFEASLISSKAGGKQVNLSNVRAKLASLTLCDEGGNLLFTETDVRELSKKSAAALQRVFETAQKLSGLGEADIEELSEGLEENPFDGSASA
jgi:hypothetical protein